MSLNAEQLLATKNELARNFELSGLTKQQICNELNISSIKFDRIMQLEQTALEDPWILKNFLVAHVITAGNQPVPFTALSGDYHRHWFLNSQTIEKAVMSLVDH